MSFQAVTWAIEQRSGSPSAKAVLWSIANYANELWCSFPKQETIANDSEQSVDSVQRRVADLVKCGLARRIKLKRYGRRTHDFIILPPSPLFEAPLEDIRQHLPSGCDVMEDAAADCGSVESDEDVTLSRESASDAAADCGSVSETTQPQSAVDATALVRQHEPVTNQESQPQTPSQAADVAKGQARQEAAADCGKQERFQKLVEVYSTSAIAPVCSNFDAAFADWLPLTPEQEYQAMLGARGAAAVRSRDPKTKTLVGLQRFLRSSVLWAEYARFAPAAKPPTPRNWVGLGSEEWRARAVLSAIVGRPMPLARPGAEGQAGADFLGSLPHAGLVLARFADAQGNVDRDRWKVLDADVDADKAKIAAWRDRVNECLGVRVETVLILLDAYVTHTKLDGSAFEARRRVNGLRVPDDWPPPKGEHAKAPQRHGSTTLMTDDDRRFLEQGGLK